MHNVFVYGSLKEGYYNHDLLEGAVKIGIGETVSKFAMVSLGEFPMVFDNISTSTIKGELYKVDDNKLEELDILEGHPYLYVRKKTDIKTDDGKMIAYIYVGSEMSSGRYRGIPIEDGIWQPKEMI